MSSMKLPLDPKRFTAYKKSTTTQLQYASESGLTFEEAHSKYPFGIQLDTSGSYVWCVCLTECYRGDFK